MVAAAVGAAAVATSVYSSSQASKAANSAANAQQDANQQSMDEQRRQFDSIQAMLKPYAEAGNQSIDAQKALIGLNGNAAQQAAFDQLKAGPAYTSAMQSGTDAILQNAAATGGLRGGNTQNSLSRFGGDLLTNLAQNQFSNLGSLTSIGQNAAAQTGNAMQNTSNNISGLLQANGAAQAGNAIAQGNANTQMANGLMQGFGSFLGAGGTKYF
jgi:hypothetical protein